MTDNNNIIVDANSGWLKFVMKVYQTINMPSGTVININTMTILVACIVQFITKNEFKVPPEWIGLYATILGFFGVHNTFTWVVNRKEQTKENIAQTNQGDKSNG
jgi:hypothetical protein